jgi:hypothetical protein
MTRMGRTTAPMRAFMMLDMVERRLDPSSSPLPAGRACDRSAMAGFEAADG